MVKSWRVIPEPFATVRTYQGSKCLAVPLNPIRIAKNKVHRTPVLRVRPAEWPRTLPGVLRQLTHRHVRLIQKTPHAPNYPTSDRPTHAPARPVTCLRA